MTTAQDFVAAWSPQGGPAWLQALRKRGIEAFAAQGVPTPRNEDWKFTSLAPLTKADLAPVRSVSATPGTADVPAVDGPALVFVDGKLDAARSTAESVAGVRVGSLAQLLGEVEATLGSTVTGDNPFDALNAAFVDDGAVVVVDAGVDAGTIHLVFASTGATSHVRNLVVAGANSRVGIVEHHVGTGAYVANPLTELSVGANATVEHTKIERESTEAFHLASIHARQARDSRFHSRSFALGGAIARTDVRTTLAEGAEVDLRGLYLAAKGQTIDHHTIVDHAAPRATSREAFKGVLDGGARGVFTGRVIVRPGATKTDSAQSVRNLLLGDAIANARPQLEILNDDVKCTHGAAVGRLDEEMLFYLRSRGIDRAEARKLLTYAFASEIVGAVRDEAVRHTVEALVMSWLGRLEERA